MKTPLLIHWPGKTDEGTTSNVPVGSMDFYPTLLEMAGVPLNAKQYVDGTSLVPLIEGNALSRDTLYWHFPHYQGEGSYPASAIRVGNYIITAEQQDGRRILGERDTAISFVPYCARYAYETFVTPKAVHASLADLSREEVLDFAEVLRETLIRFDNLWKMSFPYVMVLHQAPTDGATHDGFHFHVEIHPPLRKPNLLKYLAGPEIGGGSFLSDTSPEEKAAELQAQSTVYYKQSKG